MTILPDSLMAPGTAYYVLMRDSMMSREFMRSDDPIGPVSMHGGV